MKKLFLTKELFFAGWWLLWAALQSLLMIRHGISIRESWTDASITSSFFVLSGYVMITIVKYFQPTVKNSIAVLVSSFALAALSNSGLTLLLRALPFSSAYLSWLDTTLLVRFIFVWLMIVIAAVNGWLFSYIKEHQQDELRIKESEQLARETELNGLRQQLQPHFLFNSLNSISSLTISQPEQARKMIEQLSDFLRGTVKKDGNQMMTLEEELHHLRLYLDIEKVRFGHRLEPRVITDEEALTMKLPSLLLQPIVENAIKFGLYDTLGEVTISINSKMDNNNLLIQISNPFDPSTTVPKSGTGFGLKSVQRRLALLYHRNDLLSTQQHENIFTATIKIPQARQSQNYTS